LEEKIDYQPSYVWRCMQISEVVDDLGALHGELEMEKMLVCYHMVTHNDFT
jgi:hypothetical protein